MPNSKKKHTNPNFLDQEEKPNLGSPRPAILKSSKNAPQLVIGFPNQQSFGNIISAVTNTCSTPPMQAFSPAESPSPQNPLNLSGTLSSNSNSLTIPSPASSPLCSPFKSFRVLEENSLLSPPAKRPCHKNISSLNSPNTALDNSFPPILSPRQLAPFDSPSTENYVLGSCYPKPLCIPASPLQHPRSYQYHITLLPSPLPEISDPPNISLNFPLPSPSRLADGYSPKQQKIPSLLSSNETLIEPRGTTERDHTWEACKLLQSPPVITLTSQATNFLSTL